MAENTIKKLTWPSILIAILATAAVGEGKRKQTDAEFWDSVYSKNHVVQIQIELTSADWKTMEPKREARGPGRGRPQGGPPPRDRDRRAQGPPQQGQRPQQGPPQRNRRGQEPPNGGPPGGGGGAASSEYTYVKSKIVIDGETFADAGLRFKGNSSYRFSSRGMKRPMKIDTNRFVKGQKLYGRTKLNLSNSFLDSAFMKEKLAYNLYKSAGLATPGVGWANVTLTIDGKKTPLGIYVVIEQVDKKFLENNFGEATKDSLLMKPDLGEWEYLGDNADAYSSYEIKYGEKNVAQIKRFAELLKLIEDAPKDVFESEIGERVDLPQLAGYLAATSLLSSIDSYVGMPHNYYLLMDKADGKLRLLPWDTNEGFGTFTMGGSPEQLVDWDIDRPWVADRRILERLFETETFPKLYRTALTELVGAFTQEKLFPQIAEYRKAIATHVGKYKAGPGTKGLKMGIDGARNGYNQAVERQVLAIKPFINQRVKSVNAQLAGEREGQTLQNRRRR